MEDFWTSFFGHHRMNRWDNVIERIYTLVNRILNIEPSCNDIRKRYLTEKRNEEGKNNEKNEEKV